LTIIGNSAIILSHKGGGNMGNGSEGFSLDLRENANIPTANVIRFFKEYEKKLKLINTVGVSVLVFGNGKTATAYIIANEEYSECSRDCYDLNQEMLDNGEPYFINSYEESYNYGKYAVVLSGLSQTDLKLISLIAGKKYGIESFHRTSNDTILKCHPISEDGYYERFILRRILFHNSALTEETYNEIKKCFDSKPKKVNEKVQLANSKTEPEEYCRRYLRTGSIEMSPSQKTKLLN
jgi:hypothetical protein